MLDIQKVPTRCETSINSHKGSRNRRASWINHPSRGNPLSDDMNIVGKYTLKPIKDSFVKILRTVIQSNKGIHCNSGSLTMINSAEGGIAKITIRVKAPSFSCY